VAVPAIMHTTSSRSRRRSHDRHSRPPTADIVIFVVGLIAAAAAGVIAYRIVGPYGDGPLNMNLYRTTDPETGKALIYRRVRRADGSEVRYVVDDASRQLREIQVANPSKGGSGSMGLRFEKGKLAGIDRHDAEGRTNLRDYFNDPSGLAKVGFSLTNNGVIDAWAYRDKKGTIVKVEVSRGQDGKVDRWEYYDKGQLARVEEDDNHDGKIDRWVVYDAGIQIDEVLDRNHDGKPDRPLPSTQ
jgi:hypothetical protein